MEGEAVMPIVQQKTFPEIYKEAQEAGKLAVATQTVTPMVVISGTDQHFIADGVCGFAWVVVRPGNCGFAKWLKRMDLAHPAYEGGVMIWVSDYNQSMQRKEVHARAMASAFQWYGIRAEHGSRMD